MPMRMSPILTPSSRCMYAMKRRQRELGNPAAIALKNSDAIDSTRGGEYRHDRRDRLACPLMATTDVVVIGAGAAGCSAALAARARGADVMVVSATPGATAITCGGWSGVLPNPVAAALSDVRHRLIAARTPVAAADGWLRRFDFCPRSSEALPLPGAVVCGMVGLPVFHAAVLARMWGEQAGVELGAREILLADTPRAGWSPVSLAARLDRSARDLAATLRTLARETRAKSVIVPAVLGLEKHYEVITELEEAAGVRVLEALSPPPSVPGWRLQAKLLQAVQSKGAKVNFQRAIARERANTITGIELADGTRVTAKAFVLATGKYVGGGIEATERFVEPVLGCPIWIDHLGERFDTVEPLTLTNAVRQEDQPLLEAGVRVDAEGRPVSEDGSAIFT